MNTAITDARVLAAIDATLANDTPPSREDLRVNGFDPDPWAHRHTGYPVGRAGGGMLYLLARAVAARRVVEFATSIGMSTIFLAAAVRDNGGGLVIGSELVSEKVRTARANLEAAGLADVVDIREGDALQTLRDVERPIDLLLLDGWPDGQSPSLDRRVAELLVPKLRRGGIVFDDNSEPDVREYLLASGFHLASQPVDPRRGTTAHIAVKLVD